MQYLLFVLIALSNGQRIRNTLFENKTTIVHLFEWKWKDIANECERFLAPEGYGAVQVWRNAFYADTNYVIKYKISPPSENLIIHTPDGKRPWYERYQVMSYKLETRSGNEDDFLDMTTRCNNVGMRIYADVVVNHMTGSHKENKGTGGSTADFKKYSYPAVPYNEDHFHPFCIINNYYNATEVRDCQLLGLKDLNQTQVYVRDRIVNYINKLIRLGVAGVRIDAAKHMWPSDLKEIYKRLENLNPRFGFPLNTRPYIYQEVIYYGGEPIRPEEYTPLGDVTEFRVGSELKNVFRGFNNMKWLVNWGEQWGLSSGSTALVFIDNHDTQRSSDVLTYKEAKAYKAAIAFMLAHPYGKPRIMSSYAFTTSDQGPPSDDRENILSPIINKDDTCGNGWVCEHRWRQIYQMVGFRNAVINTNVQNWWDNGYKQIAFGRGNRGFIVFNGDVVDLNNSLQTGLPAGEYCDVISGRKVGSYCSGKKINVNDKGKAHFFILPNDEDMHIAIHIGQESKIESKEIESVRENLKIMSINVV